MSNQTLHYTHNSRIGTFHIVFMADKLWHILISGDDLGPYHTAQQALDDLTGGHCDWPGTTDPETLGLPDEIGEWTQCR